MWEVQITETQRQLHRLSGATGNPRPASMVMGIFYTNLDPVSTGR